MTKDVISVDINDKIEKVFDLMSKTSHKGFPIIDNQNLVGIISSRDLLGKIQQNKDQSIKSLMNFNNLISIIPECPVLLAIAIMNRYNVNRLPVVNDIGSRKLVGIVTRTDLNKANKDYGLLKVLNKFEDNVSESAFLIKVNNNAENSQKS